MNKACVFLPCNRPQIKGNASAIRVDFLHSPRHKPDVPKCRWTFHTQDTQDFLMFSDQCTTHSLWSLTHKTHLMFANSFLLFLFMDLNVPSRLASICRNSHLLLISIILQLTISCAIMHPEFNKRQLYVF